MGADDCVIINADKEPLSSTAHILTTLSDDTISTELHRAAYLNHVLIFLTATMK